MLHPTQMTDDTLSANIRLYDAIRRTQAGDFTRDDQDRLDALNVEREERIVASDDGLNDGIYVAKAWAHDPSQGLLWRKHDRRWENITSKSEHVMDAGPRNVETPQEFYGLGWERHITQLVAVTTA